MKFKILVLTALAFNTGCLDLGLSEKQKSASHGQISSTVTSVDYVSGVTDAGSTTDATSSTGATSGAVESGSGNTNAPLPPLTVGQSNVYILNGPVAATAQMGTKRVVQACKEAIDVEARAVAPSQGRGCAPGSLCVYTVACLDPSPKIATKDRILCSDPKFTCGYSSVRCGCGTVQITETAVSP